MSLEAMNAVLYHSRAKGTEKLVLLGIANHEGEGGSCPSVSTLARYANVAERNVQRAITRLIEMNELYVEVQAGLGRKDRKTNLYRVIVTCPVGCSGGYRHVVNGVAESSPREVVVNDHGVAPASPETSTSYLVASVKEVTPSGVTSLTTLRVKNSHETEEWTSMPWPSFEDPDEAFPRRSTLDEDTGVVGKIEDKAAKRQAKYTRTKIEAVSPSTLRHERPEADWTTNDIVAEFYDQCRLAAPGIVSQVNGAQLAAWVNRQVGQGVPRIRVLRVLRAFFEDPRNLREAGTGQPLWRRFVAFFPSAQISVPGHDHSLPEEEALMARMEEKALRDLGMA